MKKTIFGVGLECVQGNIVNQADMGAVVNAQMPNCAVVAGWPEPYIRPLVRSWKKSAEPLHLFLLSPERGSESGSDLRY